MSLIAHKKPVHRDSPSIKRACLLQILDDTPQCHRDDKCRHYLTDRSNKSGTFLFPLTVKGERKVIISPEAAGGRLHEQKSAVHCGHSRTVRGPRAGEWETDA